MPRGGARAESRAVPVRARARVPVRVPARGGRVPAAAARRPHPASREGELDRRVQMVVKSYPPSGIEEDYDAIPYPEVIIRKSNFQQGWCQVYLVLKIDDGGEVERVAVERPRPGDRPRYEPLIKAVEDVGPRLGL